MAALRRTPPPPTPRSRPEYQKSFITRVHQVLSMGYERLDPRALADQEEEDITGELTRAMQTALQDPHSPRWAKNFWAQEEIPVHGQGRLGKRRPRVDIQVMQHGVAKRPRFRFEAKRLHDARSRRAYLGHDGLGCYLEGRYAPDDEMAGMLGYVQQGTVEDHAASLAQMLRKNPKRYFVTEHGQWAVAPVVATQSTYRSVHERVDPLPCIMLLHTLLPFIGRFPQTV